MAASTPNLTQVLPLYAAVYPELTTYPSKGLAHKTRSKHMANGILKQLNQSLEITVRDGLDGLADFALQLAYAHSGTQFDILSIEEDSLSKTVPLKLVDSPVNAVPKPRRHQHG